MPHKTRATGWVGSRFRGTPVAPPALTRLPRNTGVSGGAVIPTGPPLKRPALTASPLPTDMDYRLPRPPGQNTGIVPPPIPSPNAMGVAPAANAGALDLATRLETAPPVPPPAMAGWGARIPRRNDAMRNRLTSALVGRRGRLGRMFGL